MRQRLLGSSRLELRARQMRSNLNPPEQAMWAELRGGRLGVWFKRQVVLGNRYIVDFLAPKVRVVVEVDGRRVHELKRPSDHRREEWLRRQGYRLVRVDAQVALRRPAAAVELVRRALPP